MAGSGGEGGGGEFDSLAGGEKLYVESGRVLRSLGVESDIEFVVVGVVPVLEDPLPAVVLVEGAGRESGLTADDDEGADIVRYTDGWSGISSFSLVTRCMR
jgi:hypothetical protein